MTTRDMSDDPKVYPDNVFDGDEVGWEYLEGKHTGYGYSPKHWERVADGQLKREEAFRPEGVQDCLRPLTDEAREELAWLNAQGWNTL